eukprot:gene10161-11201_t
MEYKNSDFNADKSKQYEAVRANMASNDYKVENGSPFGLLEITPIAEDEDKQEYLARSAEEKRLIRKGYNRVQKDQGAKAKF